jgi:hypothetical protein
MKFFLNFLSLFNFNEVEVYNFLDLNLNLNYSCKLIFFMMLFLTF